MQSLEVFLWEIGATDKNQRCCAPHRAKILVDKEQEVAAKDDPRFQRERIARLASEVVPGCRVVFDSEEPFPWIRFRLEDAASGQILGTSSGDWHSSEIADWPDARLRNFIGATAPYFAR